jgi:hypothetical protein
MYLDDRPVFPEERSRCDVWYRVFCAEGEAAAAAAERVEIERLAAEKADTERRKAQQAVVHTRAHQRRTEVLRSVALHTGPSVSLRGRHKIFFDGMLRRCPPGMQQVNDRCLADTFAAADFRQPGQRTEWHLALRGGLLATPEYIESGGSTGVAVECKSSIVLCRRLIWCSGQWASSHPVLHKILTTCMARPESRWQLVEGDVADFLRRSRQFNPICLGLVTPREKSSRPQLRRNKRAVTAAEFIKLFLQCHA